MKSRFLLATALLLTMGPATGGQAPVGPKATAFASIDRNQDAIAKVGDTIFSYAELGMQEHETSALCVRLLKEMGYSVQTGISGIPTAILATYGSGHPVIGVHVECDAVPSGSQTPGETDRAEIVKGAPGHAEGHNTNAALWIGAAWAVKQAMDQHHLAGTIKLFSAPAEEQGISRPYFVRDGYFKDADAAFHAYVGSDLSTSYGPRQYAVMSVEYEFFGKTAHAAVAPWTGKSAGDAVKLMDVGWGRAARAPAADPAQPLHDRERGRAAERGSRLREDLVLLPRVDLRGAKALFDKAHDVAQAAALMSGTTWKQTILSACWPTRDNKALAEVVQSNIELVGVPKWTPEEEALAKKIQHAAGQKEAGLDTAIYCWFTGGATRIGALLVAANLLNPATSLRDERLSTFGESAVGRGCQELHQADGISSGGVAGTVRGAITAWRKCLRLSAALPRPSRRAIGSTIHPSRRGNGRLRPIVSKSA